MRIQLVRNSVQLFFEWLALFQHFEQTAADIVKFKMSAGDGTSIFLVCVFVVCVNAFVVREIDVVAIRVCIDWQVVLRAWIGETLPYSLNFSRCTTPFLISHCFKFNN